jgi:hypothetical protein
MSPKPQSSPLPSLVAYQRARSLTASVWSRKCDGLFMYAPGWRIATTCTSSAAALDAQVGAANTLPPLNVCGSISC